MLCVHDKPVSIMLFTMMQDAHGAARLLDRTTACVVKGHVDTGDHVLLGAVCPGAEEVQVLQNLTQFGKAKGMLSAFFRHGHPKGDAITYFVASAPIMHINELTTRRRWLPHGHSYPICLFLYP